MVTWKMFIKKSHKNFTNVSLHINTILGIEPNNLSLSSLTLGLTWNICDVIIKPIFKSNVVIRSCFIEVIFITRVLRNSTTSQPAITCSKLTIETLEQGVKYVQS